MSGPIIPASTATLLSSTVIQHVPMAAGPTMLMNARVWEYLQSLLRRDYGRHT